MIRKLAKTYVTLAVPIHENTFWIRFDKNTELIDRRSNEHYLVRRLDDNLVLNKTMIVSGQANKMIEVTLVFPLLKKTVETFDLVEIISDDADLMSNHQFVVTDLAFFNMTCAAKVCFLQVV